VLSLLADVTVTSPNSGSWIVGGITALVGVLGALVLAGTRMRTVADEMAASRLVNAEALEAFRASSHAEIDELRGRLAEAVEGLGLARLELAAHTAESRVKIEMLETQSTRSPDGGGH
jgi:hypothetical protein